MSADIQLHKASDIGMRQLRKLANLSFDARLALIADGFPIILRSAQDLVAAAESLVDHPRATEVLLRHGEAVAFTEFEDRRTAGGLIRATIEGLEAQHSTTEAATNEDVQTLYRLWPWPMYDIDFTPLKISLADLKEEQERHLYANF